jgi:FG-GAP-like repeat/FG-GAP repeat
MTVIIPTLAIDENIDTTSRVEIDDLNNNINLQDKVLTLSGDDASKFEIDGGKLYLKVGQVVDYEIQSTYLFNVDTVDYTQALTVDVNNVNEAATNITLSANPIVYTVKTDTDNPFDAIDVGVDSTPTLADIDGDGKLDLVVGEGYGQLKYYKNTGTAIAPIYTEQTGLNNPFDGIVIENSKILTDNDTPFDGFNIPTPTLADIDGDGDIDLVVGERYGTLKYYKNTGTAIVPIYTKQTDPDNPFDAIVVGNVSTPTFADIDGDGKLDLVVGESFGKLKYYRNTGSALAPIYTEQTGPDNPFNAIAVGFFSTPTFADIDGDGKLDLVVGEIYGTLKYYRNTSITKKLLVTPSKLAPIIPSMALISGLSSHPHWPISMGMATSISLSVKLMAISTTTKTLVPTSMKILTQLIAFSSAI